MSRNPYLAASRPSSSYTRSSRSSTRTGAGGASGAGTGGLLGRSRSSATLGRLASHTYGSSSLSASSYVPQWQRSSSSTRASGQQASSYSRPAADEWQSTRSLGNTRGLYKSTSSHSLAAAVAADNDDDDEKSPSHLKNYQDTKLQQQQQQQTQQQTQTQTQTQTPRPTIARATRASLASLDSDNASQSDYTREPSEAGSSPALDVLEESATIGDNIPSASARHLRSAQHGQLAKAKSLELPGGRAAEAAESPLLHGSMSVDRLLLRADSMGERDLRKSFKELVMENERLKQQLKGFDDKDYQRQQDWIRKERQLHRKISELEEENKQLEHWKMEIQRLKDENNSLIRVVSKLTKQHH